FTADHGEMMGEHGMWYKMSFFEWAERVPLVLCAPGRFAPRREARNVSLVDLLPTILDLAGEDAVPRLVGRLDGRSLVGRSSREDEAWPDCVAAEYLGEGARGPCLMLKRGHHKFMYGEDDPDQLYDLAADPLELHNLAGRNEGIEIARRM